MQVAALPAWGTRLLADTRVARLAYSDADGRPRLLPITFALVGDSVWSAIDQKPKRSPEPARLRALRRSPRAAVLIDRYSDDWDELAWVQLLGSALVLDAVDAGEGARALCDRYRQYRDAPPAGPFIRLDVQRMLCWRAADAD